MAAEVHEGKEAEQSVIVGIEIAVLKGFVACLICYVTGMASRVPVNDGSAINFFSNSRVWDSTVWYDNIDTLQVWCGR